MDIMGTNTEMGPTLKELRNERERQISKQLEKRVTRVSYDRAPAEFSEV